MTIGTIILSSIFVIIPTIITIIALVKPGQQSRDLITRFMSIIQLPFEVMRNGMQTMISKTTNIFRSAMDTIGISGPHLAQRIVGMLILTAAFLVSNIVSFVTNALTIAGIMNAKNLTDNIDETDSENKTLSNIITAFLKINPEELLSLELVASIVVCSMLLLDVFGITHTTKFLSTEFLNKKAKWFIASILSITTIFSVYLFVMTGTVRKGSLFPEDASAKIQTENVEINEADFNSGKNTDFISYNSAPKQKSTYEESAGLVLVGIPYIAAICDAFAAFGLLTFAGFILFSMCYIIANVPAGITYFITYLISRLLDLIYNLWLNIIDVFRPQYREGGIQNESRNISNNGSSIREGNTTNYTEIDNNTFNRTQNPVSSDEHVENSENVNNEEYTMSNDIMDIRESDINPFKSY